MRATGPHFRLIARRGNSRPPMPRERRDDGASRKDRASLARGPGGRRHFVDAWWEKPGRAVNGRIDAASCLGACPGCELRSSGPTGVSKSVPRNSAHGVQNWGMSPFLYMFNVQLPRLVAKFCGVQCLGTGMAFCVLRIGTALNIQAFGAHAGLTPFYRLRRRCRLAPVSRRNVAHHPRAVVANTKPDYGAGLKLTPLVTHGRVNPPQFVTDWHDNLPDVGLAERRKNEPGNQQTQRAQW